MSQNVTEALIGVVLAILVVRQLIITFRTGATSGVSLIGRVEREKKPGLYWIAVAIYGVFLAMSLWAIASSCISILEALRK